jgi:hypothetical protein
MNLLRYVLVAATLAALGALFYTRATSRPSPVDHTDILLWWMFLIGLVLNLIYLVLCPPGIPKSPSRLRKLVSLWLDAKERELRDRAGKS